VGAGLRRSYAAQLLHCFDESLQPVEALRAPRLRALAMSRPAIDFISKVPQRRDRWYSF